MKIVVVDKNGNEKFKSGSVQSVSATSPLANTGDSVNVVIAIGTAVTPTLGGTGQNFSASTGFQKWTAGVASVTGIVASDLTSALASPPDIGGTTPAKGWFSELKIKIGGFFATITHALTADRTFTLPDEAGTFQLKKLTAKGDSLTHNGTTDVREGVGSNNTVLTADSTQTTGRKWSLVDLVNSITGTLGIGNGGTGAASLAGHGAVVMNSGGTAQTSVAPGAAGNTLRSDGTDWASTAAAKASSNIILDPSFEYWDTTNNANDYLWALTGASATIAREATIIKHGLYSAKLTRSGTDCTYTQDIYIPAGSTFVRSRTYVFGAWVYATVASRVRLVMNDGVTVTNSAYHSGGSAWEWLTVSATLGAAITTFKVGLAVDTGNTSGYIDACAIAEGAALDAAAYPSFGVDGYGRAIFSYEVAQGTAGGTYTAPNAMTRPLNTTRWNTIQGASLSSNQVVLPAGLYRAKFDTQSYAINGLQCWLQNITDAAVVTGNKGLTAFSTAGSSPQFSSGFGMFLITAQKTIELQMAAGATRGTDGMGTAANLAAIGGEVYSIVEFEKVA